MFLHIPDIAYDTLWSLSKEMAFHGPIPLPPYRLSAYFGALPSRDSNSRTQPFDYFVSTVCNSLQRNPDSGLFILAI